MSIKKAVNKTVAYSRFFNFPLTSKEIHHWLISSKTYSYQQIQPFFPPKIKPENQLIRQRLFQITTKKRDIARQALCLIKLFPSIKLVAITGSVAIGNPDEDDDIDLLIVTSSHTLWLTRLFLIPLFSLFFKRRQPKLFQRQSNSFCFNLWLDRCSLTVPKSKRSLYTAHEVLQIYPIYDRDFTYARFIRKNSWTKKYLANAYTHICSQFSSKSVSKPRLTIFTIVLLNRLAYKIQRFYMNPKITKEIVSLHQAFFHPRDLTPTINHYLSKKLKASN